MTKRDGSNMTAKREDLDIAPIFGYDLPVWRYGVWVVRDADGAHVDHDRYRHDLTARYPGLVLIGE